MNKFSFAVRRTSAVFYTDSYWHYTPRCNRTLPSIYGIPALNKHGRTQNQEPVVGEGDEYALTEKELPAVFKEYEILAKRILDNEKNGKKFNFFHFMLDLDQGPCAIKRLRGCGCGNDYVAITPDGDIFPCHQFVGIDEYKMGNIDEGTFNQEMKADFASCHVYSKPEREVLFL